MTELRPVYFAALLVSMSALLFAGCGGGGGVSLSSYEVEIEDTEGMDYALEGESVKCKPNTSFPDSDPLKGKFYVGIVHNLGPQNAIITLHFTEFTDTPPAGTYVEGEGLDVSFSFTNNGEDEPAGARDFSGVSSG